MHGGTAVQKQPEVNNNFKKEISLNNYLFFKNSCKQYTTILIFIFVILQQSAFDVFINRMLDKFSWDKRKFFVLIKFINILIFSTFLLLFKKYLTYFQSLNFFFSYVIPFTCNVIITIKKPAILSVLKFKPQISHYTKVSQNIYLEICKKLIRMI